MHRVVYVCTSLELSSTEYVCICDQIFGWLGTNCVIIGPLWWLDSQQKPCASLTTDTLVVSRVPENIQARIVDLAGLKPLVAVPPFATTS